MGPMVAAAVWGGRFFFGTADGRVCEHTGSTDGAGLDGAGAQAIRFSALTAFQGYGDASRFKRVHFIRPLFSSESAAPNVLVQARFDFDQGEPPASVPGGFSVGSAWGTARWDRDVWSGGAVVKQTLYGAQGMGRNVALALVGESMTPCTLVGFSIYFDVGGLL